MAGAPLGYSLHSAGQLPLVARGTGVRRFAATIVGTAAGALLGITVFALGSEGEERLIESSVFWWPTLGGLLAGAAIDLSRAFPD